MTTERLLALLIALNVIVTALILLGRWSKTVESTTETTNLGPRPFGWLTWWTVHQSDTLPVAGVPLGAGQIGHVPSGILFTVEPQSWQMK